MEKSQTSLHLFGELVKQTEILSHRLLCSSFVSGSKMWCGWGTVFRLCL